MTHRTINAEETIAISPRSLKRREINEELKNQSDRVVAIVAFAYLDTFLEQAVRTRLRDRSSTVDELFKPIGILGPFEARRRLGYALGLFGKKTFRDLRRFYIFGMILPTIMGKSLSVRKGSKSFAKVLDIPSVVRLYSCQGEHFPNTEGNIYPHY